MIRVLIADDHPIVREGIKYVLDKATGIEVGGEAENGIEVLKILRSGKFDVILLDISMPEKNGFDTLKQIIQEGSGVKVLILSAYSEDQHAVRLMKAGASGYMIKNDSLSKQLVEAIRNVVAGKKHISPALAELLLQECGAGSSKPSHELLSPREYQALRLLGSGRKMSEISEAMSISVKTVSTYRTKILEKMKLKNTAELTFYVMENSLHDSIATSGEHS